MAGAAQSERIPSDGHAPQYCTRRLDGDYYLGRCLRGHRHRADSEGCPGSQARPANAARSHAEWAATHRTTPVDQPQRVPRGRNPALSGVVVGTDIRAALADGTGRASSAAHGHSIIGRGPRSASTGTHRCDLRKAYARPADKRGACGGSCRRTRSDIGDEGHPRSQAACRAYRAYRAPRERLGQALALTAGGAPSPAPAYGPQGCDCDA